MLSNHYVVIAIGVLLALVAPYLMALKYGKTNTFAEFSASKDTFSSFSICLSMLGTIVGGGMFFAVSALGFRYGAPAISFGIASAAGLFFIAFLSLTIREQVELLKVSSLPELIEVKVGCHASVAFSSIQYLAHTCLLAAQFAAIAMFLKYLSVDKFQSLVIVGVIVMTAFVSWLLGSSGLKKDIWSDKFQLLAVMIGVAAIYWDNIPTKFAGSPATAVIAEPQSSALMMIIGAFLFLPLTFLARVDVWQRVITAKTALSAKRGLFFAGLGSIAAYSCFVALGIMAKLKGCEVASESVMCLITNGNVGLLNALVFAALLGAVVGTADTYVNVNGVLFSGLISRITNTESSKLRVARVGALISVVLAISLYFLLVDIVFIFSAAFGFILLFVPTVFEALFVEKPEEGACVCGIAVGCVVFLAFASGMSGEIAFIPAFMCAFSAHFLWRFYAKRQRKQTVGE